MAQNKLGSVVALVIPPGPKFDPNTGKPTEAVETCFEPRFEWPRFIENSLGYTVQEVLHYPEGAKKLEELRK